MNEEIKMIPIERIRILNPRQRDQKKFEIIVQCIKNLGLKKPIQVSLRATDEAEGPGYDLVCGQGRIEAFIALGHKEIPAIVIEVSKEERLIRSLVENIARRHPAPMDLIREIERLKALAYNNHEISKKLDVCDSTVKGLLTLKKAGEERLLGAAITGKIPLWVAIDIARTDTVETQRELLRAYENKQLNYLSIRTVKRLIEQRRLIGKQRGGRDLARQGKTSVESLVSAYRRESQRQKLMVKKAKVCDARLGFIVTAFNKLLADEHFVTLLRAESLATMPKYLWSKLSPKHKEAE